MQSIRILVADDDELIREMLNESLQQEGFTVTTAANVPEALKLISSNLYDVLLSDLHMPGAGDGLTVASAMRHVNPNAVTMLWSAFPKMDAASNAILLHADQILLKPMNPEALVIAIKERLATGPAGALLTETAATILERTTESTIRNWYVLTQRDERIMAVSMTFEERSGHLPQILNEIVRRLRSLKPIDSTNQVSVAAVEHGSNRRRQGYSAAMLMDESRMFQVSVFQSLRENLIRIDFNILLNDVMTIADEIDSQLGQTMLSYAGEPYLESLSR